jgi:hypothetical protein
MIHRSAMISFAVTIALLPVHSADDAPRKEKTTHPLRVLLFASSPTREYQFLRSLLVRKNDAKRAELSILLQPPPGGEPRSGAVQDVPAERMLTSFPERLQSYDVVVAFDPDWTRLSAAESAALKKWVESDGAVLILVAGPVNTFQLARKAADKLGPIRDLYPVIPEDLRALSTDIDTSAPRRLTFPDGPGERGFLKLDAGGKQPLAGWSGFFTDPKTKQERGFYCYYPVRGVKENAIVLAALADTKARLKDGKDQPFLVTMSAGKGRVVYLSSGETWRVRQYRPAYHERFWLGLLNYSGAGRRDPEKPADPEQLSANELKLEVQALQGLYRFQMTPAQLRFLATLALRTAPVPQRRKPGKVSDDYRQLLLDLRAALLDVNDEENIDSLEDKLDQLTEDEKPTLDDDIEMSLEARKRAPEVLRRLKPSQLAHYLGYVEDDIADPHERLHDGLEQVRAALANEWEAKRDEIAEEVGWLVVGVDLKKCGLVTKRAAALLSMTRGLSAEEYKKQRNDLEREADRIVGDVGPATVLEHTIEHALAELLSNPRLASALAARLH